MEKTINGKTYKEVKINKMIINGHEENGCVIPAEKTTGDNEMTVTIFTDNSDEEKSDE